MRFPIRIPFADLLGLELQQFGDDRAVVSCLLREDLCNSMGGAHGGVTMSLLDIAMVHAARAPRDGAPPASSRCATIEMKSTFMRPGRGGLRATGRVLHRAGSMVFCEGSVVDEAGELVAHGTGSFKLLA